MKRVFAHIGFSFALTLIVLNLIQKEWVLVILVITGALFIVSILLKKTREAAAVPLCFACSVLACVLFMAVCSGSLEPQLELNGKSAETVFYISDVEEVADNGYFYTVKTQSVDIEGAPQNIKLSLKSNYRINADYYQLIKGKIKFTKIADNGFSSYGSFGENIFLYGRLDSCSVCSERINNPMRLILYLKENIKTLFETELTGDSGGLALALVTGLKNNISDETVSDFKACGASHIMAVSGLHLAVISGSMYFLLKKMLVPKIPRALISICLIVFYAALSGFSKSIVRSGIMMTVLLIARIFNEKCDSLNSLGIAVFIICLNPFSVTDAGALLTVTAVMGIILIVPVINHIYYPKTRAVRYIYDIVSVSVSVFVTTFPVMYFMFGAVSVISPAVNVILIPAAQFSLIGAFLMIIFQNAAFVFKIFTFLCKAGTGLMLKTVKHFADISFALADISSVSVGLIISAVLILFGLSFVIRKKHTLKICSVICAVMIILISSVSYAVNIGCVYVRVICGYNSTALFIYDSERAVAIGISDSNQYYTAERLSEAKNLDLSLIIDTNDSIYSEKLTSVCKVKNYAVKDSYLKNDLKCDNITELIDFNVDLWDNLNVEYRYENNNPLIKITVFNTVFEYGSSNTACFYEGEKIYSDISFEYDIIYTVNDDGFIERRTGGG